MSEEELELLTQEVSEFLSEKISEYFEQEGRGVFFIEMETNEITYVPEDDLHEEISDPESLKQMTDYIQEYNPVTQFCLLIFQEDEMVFNIGWIEQDSE
ncbi:MAG: hypothetical protein HQM14_20560 [SAR324 cluster bacterium]|nr:hypothetical protein [SAR324 cluster bacterium]